MNTISPVSVCTDSSGYFLPANETGFTLLEFIVSTVILLVISMVLFGAVNEIQHTAGFHVEMQAVLDNTRMALQTLERRIRQAGNDPYRKGFEAVSIINPTEVRFRSDITGSAGPGNPDKGDPDGDTNDSGENLTIRYNEGRQRIELISGNGPAQIIADNISGLSLEYLDADGNPTGTGGDVRKIIVTISGTAPRSDPATGRRFGVQLSSTIRILSAQRQK